MATINSDIDTQTKSSVITNSVSPQMGTMDDFFQGDSMPATGSFSEGAMPIVTDSSSVLQFLSRPILVATQVWDLGTSPYLTINPWHAYLTHPTVKPRLSYFGRLRTDMVLRVVVNGTPMHYGCVRVCYRPHPLTDITGDYVFNQAVAIEAAAHSSNLRTVMSQLSGFYINPCRDSGGELRIPYMSPLPGIELGYGTEDFSRLGTLYTVGFAPLANAGTGTGPVTLEFYLHCENTQLDVPTAIPQGYTLQDAGRTAGRIIRAAAKATAIANEWVPRALSAAAMMGFSRPLSHELPLNARNIPYNLANYDEADSSTSLSLSVSAEHTIGGQELGTGGQDELLLSSIAARPAHIASTTWVNSHPAGHFVMGSIVTPIQVSVSDYTKAAVAGTSFATIEDGHICMTPCAFAAALAQYWRADMVYRFTVVSSPYHKGRLRFYYDPYPHSRSFPSPTMNLANSVVLDLANANMVEVVVPWQNVRDMAACGSISQPNTFTIVGGFNSRCADVSTTDSNGIIVCEVLSPLTCIEDGSNATVLLEVYAKDMVLYCPLVPRVLSNPLAMDGAAVPYVPQSYDITGGDAILSLRQPLKRYMCEFSGTIVNMNTGGANTSVTSCVSTLVPVNLPVPGYPFSFGDPLGTDASRLAVNVDDSGLVMPVSYTGLAFHTYVATAFCMARGSIRWKLVVSRFLDSGPRLNVIVARYPRILPAVGARNDSLLTNTLGAVTPVDLGRRSRTIQEFRESSSGAQLAGDDPSLLDVEFPHTTLLRARNPRFPLSEEEPFHNNAKISLELSRPATAGDKVATYEVYTSVGEDYNLFGFVHAPAFLVKIPTKT